MSLLLVESLTDSQKLEAAPLIYQTFPSYYDLFSLDQVSLDASISRQFSQMSELNTYIAAVDQDRVVGLICFFPNEEFEIRKFAGTKDLLSSSPDRKGSLQRLKVFSDAIVPIPEPGIYLPRVSVAPSYQGKGISQKLLEAVINWSKARSHPALYLHVKKENARARAFYQKSGFEQMGESPLPPYLITMKLSH